MYRFLYRSYCWFYVQSQWRRTRLTRPGAVMVSAALLAGLTGINIFQSAIYQILILCLVYLGVSAAFSFFGRVRIRVTRILPEYAAVGKELTYTLELVNKGSRTEKGLVLFESLADPRPDLHTLLTQKEPFERSRNAWDRKTLYYRWLWLIRKNLKTVIQPVPLPDLPPDTRIRVKIRTTPHTRGYLDFSGIILARPDPMGLFHHLTRITLKQKLLILPRSFDMEIPQFESARKYHAGGVWLASSVGNADEFISLRDYRPGDPLRHIHWKTYARTRNLVVREFEDEYFVRHGLVLDTCLPSGTDSGDTVFETAVAIAASLIRSTSLSEALLDLMFVGRQVYAFPWGRGLGGSGTLLEVLACVQPWPGDDVTQLSAHIRAHLDLLSGSILIFLDWDKAREQLAVQIQAAGIPVRVILVCPDENGAENQLKKKLRMVPPDLPHITIVTAGRAEKELGLP